MWRRSGKHLNVGALVGIQDKINILGAMDMEIVHGALDVCYCDNLRPRLNGRKEYIYKVSAMRIRVNGRSNLCCPGLWRYIKQAAPVNHTSCSVDQLADLRRRRGQPTWRSPPPPSLWL
jgi:hypothetical protein